MTRDQLNGVRTQGREAHRLQTLRDQWVPLVATDQDVTDGLSVLEDAPAHVSGLAEVAVR
jgi:hypothetical protein